MSQADDDAHSEHAPPSRVLLVDDNRAERVALSRLFEIRGFSVVPVADGRSAIAAIDRGQPFDILITDLRLPDMDGREIALRASKLRPKPLVALMTGWDPEQEDRQQWGIDLIFIKPIDSADMVLRLRSAQRAAMAD
jgi:CheY-like chemotaxis protein